MGVKKQKKKGKKKTNNKPTSKKYSKYTIEGNKIVRTGKFCPRCGPGIFLMNSDGRTYCGKCHYSEFGPKGASSGEGKAKQEVKEISKKK